MLRDIAIAGINFCEFWNEFENESEYFVEDKTKYNNKNR